MSLTTLDCLLARCRSSSTASAARIRRSAPASMTTARSAPPPTRLSGELTFTYTDAAGVAHRV